MSSIDAYLAELTADLRGSPKQVGDIVAEVRAGLEEVADQHQMSGMSRHRAERLAVDEFGPVTMIGPAFQEVLAVRESRRTALTISLVIASQPLVWGPPYDAATKGTGTPFDGVHGALSIAVALVGVAAVAFMLIALGTSHLGGSSAGRHSRLARRVAWIGIGSTAAVGLLGTALGAVGLVSSDVPTVLMVSWALMFFFAPLVIASQSARRALQAASRIKTRISA